MGTVILSLSLSFGAHTQVLLTEVTPGFLCCKLRMMCQPPRWLGPLSEVHRDWGVRHSHHMEGVLPPSLALHPNDWWQRVPKLPRVAGGLPGQGLGSEW